MIIYLGTLFILIGTIFLFVPLIYLELGRPKDLIIAFLNLIIGLTLIIKNKIFDESLFLFFLLTILLVLFLIEISLFRWNQLTDTEKNKLITFLELKKNLSKILEAFNLGVRNFSTPLNLFNYDRKVQDIIPKKWVRNDNNDKIKN